MVKDFVLVIRLAYDAPSQSRFELQSQLSVDCLRLFFSFTSLSLQVNNTLHAAAWVGESDTVYLVPRMIVFLRWFQMMWI